MSIGNMKEIQHANSAVLALRRLRIIACILLAMVFVQSNQSALASEHPEKYYVGIQYPPLPNGCASKGGGVISAGLAFTEVMCPEGHLFWLERSMGGQTAKSWKVIDSIKIPLMKKGQQMEVTDCEMRGSPNALVFAIGTWKKKHEGGDLRNITFAFWIDSEKQRIAVVDPRRVRCGYTGENRD